MPKKTARPDGRGQRILESGLKGLMLEGFPPPVDASPVAWATFTPYPAIMEVNGASALNMCEFYDSVSSLYQSAFCPFPMFRDLFFCCPLCRDGCRLPDWLVIAEHPAWHGRIG